MVIPLVRAAPRENSVLNANIIIHKEGNSICEN
jgi:hypothetical protein